MNAKTGEPLSKPGALSIYRLREDAKVARYKTPEWLLITGGRDEDLTRIEGRHLIAARLAGIHAAENFAPSDIWARRKRPAEMVIFDPSVLEFQSSREIKPPRRRVEKNDMTLGQRLLRKFQESQVQRDDRGRFKDIPGRGADSKGADGAPSFRQASWSTMDNGPKRTPPGVVQNIWAKRNPPAPERLTSAADRLEAAAARRQSAGQGDFVAEMAAQKMRDKAEGLRYAADASPILSEEGVRRFKQHIPKAIGHDAHFDNLRRVQSYANSIRADVIERAMEPDRRGRAIIPEGTPISDIKRAYRHATAIAMNDAYLIEYDYKLSDSDRATYAPLENFIRYTTRRMKSDLTSGEFKGMQAPYRSEFGVPFIDKKTGQQKINRMTGEGRVRPPRPTNNQFIKSDAPVVRDARWLDDLSDAIELASADRLADRVLLKSADLRRPRGAEGGVASVLAKRAPGPSHLREML
ncbi:hypothetical protein [Falsiroseomonas sp. CW058]|uniref:hypothetical protein n=1 Tax=Falsiroseomonas sp. CW058 TaxID=3388664 RepID=UPI003D31B6AC